jgi:PAS domain S-box-containing protein
MSRHEAIVMLDRAGKVLMANQAAHKLFGYAARDLCGQSITHHLQAIAMVPLPAPGAQIFRTVMECRGERKDGEIFLAQVWFSTYSTRSGPRLAAIEARQRRYAGRILLVTAGMSDALCVQVLKEGASGIFLKEGTPALLVEAIRKVIAGERWVDQRCLNALISAAGAGAQPVPAESFTDRERSLLRGVFEGMSNKEIAAQLEISESSVKGSLQQLFQKTGARSRSQLVRIALEEFGGQSGAPDH